MDSRYQQCSCPSCKIMRYPSVKSIEQLTSRYTHPWMSPNLTARCIRAAMESLPADSIDNIHPSAMEVINDLLGLYGVDRIPQGNNDQSPSILYCNSGDAYEITMMHIKGRYIIGCWGDIVERGNYD